MASATLTIEPHTTNHALSSNAELDAAAVKTIRSEHEAQMQPSNGDDVLSAASTSSPSLRSSLSWTSVRSSLTLSDKASANLAWVIAFLSVLFTVVALSPAFKSQSMTERALELAEWTAWKDFIEECREEIAAGFESQACLKALKAQIPPPPYVKAGILKKMRRGIVQERQGFNGTARAMRAAEQDVFVDFPISGFIGLTIVLAACVLFFLSLERRRALALRRPQVREALEDADEKLFEPPPVLELEPAVSRATIRYPPQSTDSSLRRRPVRTHPIYRHATLDEAIYAADLSEIRTRLQNGEDVNQHWSYLIYRLAISPKAPDIAKRIEVARMCLDFGADVNALKGWNGQSALLIAIHFGNVDVAKLLIANGATVGYSPPDSHLTALHRCVRLAATGSSTDALEIMEMLFKYGAKANQVDRLNETPLHKLLIDSWYARHDDATSQRLFPIALCLVEHGAHVIPGSLREKFVFRNPLYELVQAEMWERKKRVADGRDVRKEGRLWTGLDDAERVSDKALHF
jgi:hypothetical protein